VCETALFCVSGRSSEKCAARRQHAEAVDIEGDPSSGRGMRGVASPLL